MLSQSNWSLSQISSRQSWLFWWYCCTLGRHVLPLLGYGQRQHRPQVLPGTRKGVSNHYISMRLCPRQDDSIPPSRRECHGPESLKRLLGEARHHTVGLEKCPYPSCPFTVPGAWTTEQRVDEGHINVIVRHFKKDHGVVFCAALRLRTSPMSFALSLQSTLNLTIPSCHRHTSKT